MVSKKQGFRIDFLESYSEEDIISELQRISETTGKRTVSKKDIDQYGKLSYAVVNKKFGSLRAALQASGLEHSRFMKATESELINIVLRVWEDTLATKGRRPYRTDLKVELYGVSSDTVVRRFGSWKKALLSAYEAVGSPESHDATPNDVLDSKTESRSEPRVSRSISLRKRFFVLKRDEFCCQLCGASGAGIKLEVDHRLAVAKGGSDRLDNLWTLCFDCNRGKRDSDLSE